MSSTSYSFQLNNLHRYKDLLTRSSRYFFADLDSNYSSMYDFAFFSSDINIFAEVKKSDFDLKNQDIGAYDYGSNYSFKVVRSRFRKLPNRELLRRLLRYERKFGISSDKFYSLYKKNMIKEKEEYIDWANLYSKLFLVNQQYGR